MTTVLQAPTSAMDIWSDEILADPHDAFTELREQGAAVYLESSDVWAITRYDEIRSALADWETFTSTRVAFNPQMNEVLIGTSLASDPPLHTQMRAALTENLTPRALRGLKGTIEEKADRIVAELVTRDAFDGVHDLARELPLQIVLDLIGVQGDVREKILDWGASAFNLLGPMNERSQQSFPLAGELFEWTHGMDGNQLAEGSIGRAVFDAGARGDIPPELCGHIIHQYLAAGMDTTIGAIANAVRAFGENPDQFTLVKADPSLIPAAFNETLRHQALLHAVGRGTTRDVTIDGVTIPGGSQVAILLYAGNRDPRHYDDPDTFRVERNPIDHLSFGYGVHGCAGQGLARLEAYAAIGAFCRHVESFSVGTAVPKLNNSSRALASLPVFDVVVA
ncbi:cytochrome P450 [Microbacterium sp.]|uniref:cytochrome P450 n=1 Tax=Microbacterium sp. TaxID=51671 RepID=UPI003A8E539E